jgi:hypothetical protein
MNPEYIFFIGMGIMITTIIVSKILSEKGLKTLTNEEKGMLISNFSKTRMASVIILMSIVIIYLAAMYSGASVWLSNHNIDPTLSYFVLIALYIVILSTYTLKKQREMGLPKSYLDAQLKSQIVRFVGIVSLCIGMYFYFRTLN